MNITKEQLAKLIKEAQEAHHIYEEKLGKKDEYWPKWYAEYIIKRLERDDITGEL